MSGGAIRLKASHMVGMLTYDISRTVVRSNENIYLSLGSKKAFGSKSFSFNHFPQTSVRDSVNCFMRSY